MNTTPVFFRPRGVKEGLAAGYVLMRIAEKAVPSEAGCWEWTGAHNGKGYGCIHLKNHPWPERTVSLHRLIFEMCVGDVGDSHVLHRCDNPKCLRPDHLFLGTNLDNIADKVAKGRQAVGESVRSNHSHIRGEAVKTAKFTEDVVREARRRVASGERQRTVAKDLGMSTAQLSSIVLRKSWKHVD